MNTENLKTSAQIVARCRALGAEAAQIERMGDQATPKQRARFDEVMRELLPLLVGVRRALLLLEHDNPKAANRLKRLLNSPLNSPRVRPDEKPSANASANVPRGKCRQNRRKKSP